MKHELKFKSFKIDQFGVDENNRLTISGWAATFNNKDSGGDVIMPGAFAKTLQDRKGRIAFCYMHEIDEPIAKILVLEEREKGLWVEAMISASEEDIQTKVAEKIIQEMSIGYSVVQYGPEKFMGDQTSYLQELKLYEISLVTIAMNEMAVIESMKSEERTNHVAESFERLLINAVSYTHLTLPTIYSV